MAEKKRGGAHLAAKETVPSLAKKTKVDPEAKESGEGQAKARRPQRKMVILGACLAVLLVGCLAVGLFINSKLDMLNYSDGKKEGGELSEEQAVTVDTSGLDEWGAPVESTLEPLEDDGILNILLLGTDGLETEYVDDARADSIIILSLDLEENAAKLTSLQRGIGMPILEGQYEGKYDLITHIFARGGADMMMKDVSQCFKIPVERYVRVNFTALIHVIDVLGGIDMELTKMEAWYLESQRTGKSVHPYISHGFIEAEGCDKSHAFVEGDNHLTGSMALAYARLRAIDDDWHRIQRQRAVLQACADKLKDADLATLNELANKILPLVETNLTKMEIAELLLEAPGFLSVEFQQLSLPEEGSYGGMYGLDQRTMLAVDFDYNSKLLREFIYGSAE